MRLWHATNNQLLPLQNAALERGSRLEEWLFNDLSLIGLDAIAIGRQIATPFGGRIDLLALDENGDLIVVEIKRDETPREIVAQALDYASWVRTLSGDMICLLYREKSARDLWVDYRTRFGVCLPERLNGSHRIVLVASAIDIATRRIVTYLNEVAGLAISTAIVRPFRFGSEEILAFDGSVGRYGLAPLPSVANTTAPSGIWFVNAGCDPNVDWEDNRRFGYIGVAGPEAQLKRLLKIETGDWVFAYRKSALGVRGYVGFAEVIGEAAPPEQILIDGTGFFELDLDPSLFLRSADVPERLALVLPVRWTQSFAEHDARRFKGAFAYQNVACRLTDPTTLDFLKREFSSV